MSKRIHVIINPASGQDQPILKTLDTVFSGTDVDWDVSLTKKASAAQNLTKQAVAKNVDVLAVSGGDGSDVEIASGLLGSDVPLAILPGGISNMIARKLNIPRTLVKAGQLLADPNSHLRPIDRGL